MISIRFLSISEKLVDVFRNPSKKLRMYKAKNILKIKICFVQEFIFTLYITTLAKTDNACYLEKMYYDLFMFIMTRCA